MKTDYSKLIDDVGIRRDHSLLIRSTRSLRERDYRTDADLKDSNAIVNENYEIKIYINRNCSIFASFFLFFG